MIQSVERAAAILQTLRASQGRLGVTEVAERVGLAKGTAYGLLRTLEGQHLVEQDAETGRYQLGLAVLELGNAYLRNSRLRGGSLIWSESLSSRTRETVRVGVLTANDVLVIHHVFRPDESIQVLEVGSAIPWHACAMGKAIVASAEPPVRRALLGAPLPRLTGRTCVDPEALAIELNAVAATGIAYEGQQANLGEAAIGAAVFDGAGHVVGAIEITGPVERLLPDGPAGWLAAAVREAARGISRDLGARFPLARETSG